MFLYWICEFLADIWSSVVLSISDSRYYKLKEAQRMKNYLSVTAEELVCMPDIELFAVPWYQLTKKYGITKAKTLAELERFNKVQQIFWAVNIYEQKSYGGILEFLTSEYNYVAPFLTEALNAIGATKHSKQLVGFMERNGIVASTLTDFCVGGLKRKVKSVKLDELRSKYGAAAFDIEYAKLEPIEKYLIPYIRENASMLLADVPDEVGKSKHKNVL